MTTEANDADRPFFTPAVKPMLDRLDSFKDYSRTGDGSVTTQLGPMETAFIAGQDSFYVAAVGEDRRLYTQRHRGPKGFLRVLGAPTLGFASLASSRRYISAGNALLFLIDHASQARLKIWADAEVSEDLAIIEKLAKNRSHSPATQLAFLFHVRALNWNYEKHIVQRSSPEVLTIEAPRTGKADPLQRTPWIEQQQGSLGPTRLERGITSTNWTQVVCA